MADEAPERWLVVGLGNPGAQYQRTRHNVGFFVVDLLASAIEGPGLRPSGRFKGELVALSLGKHPALLLKPQTYMNLSGESVEPVAHFYRIAPERIIAIHDDVDLELGRLKIKQGGGDGGHKGLRSMSERLGSPDYFRVRIGIGRPRYGEVRDYVLQNFAADEQEAVEEVVGTAAKAIRILIARGLREAMNRYNRGPAALKGPPAATKNSEIDLESRSKSD